MIVKQDKPTEHDDDKQARAYGLIAWSPQDRMWVSMIYLCPNHLRCIQRVGAALLQWPVDGDPSPRDLQFVEHVEEEDDPDVGGHECEVCKTERLGPEGEYEPGTYMKIVGPAKESRRLPVYHLRIASRGEPLEVGLCEKHSWEVTRICTSFVLVKRRTEVERTILEKVESCGFRYAPGCDACYGYVTFERTVAQ